MIVPREAEWRERALNYLKRELGVRAPTALGPASHFDASALEGEGAVVVFPFETTIADRPSPHYVVVGQTEPNYYPALSLTPEEGFRVHLGTRFMLVLQVSECPPSEQSAYDPRPDVERLVAQVAPGESVDQACLAAMFRVGAEVHALCRCRIAGQDVYVMTRDCPPGFYRRTELPPHVVYRLHLGTLVLTESA